MLDRESCWALARRLVATLVVLYRLENESQPPSDQLAIDRVLENRVRDLLIGWSLGTSGLGPRQVARNRCHREFGLALRKLLQQRMKKMAITLC